MISAADLPEGDRRRAQELTDRDHQLVAAMQNLGIPRITGMVIVALAWYSNGRPVTSRWIERTADLRQPEVSIALQALGRDGFLRVTHQNKAAIMKGRPLKEYQLARPALDYVHEIIEQRKQAVQASASQLYALWPKTGAAA